MSRHVSYRGVTLDMEALTRENEKSVAIGNMKVNAKGDQIGKGGAVTRTADQIARDNHRVQSAVVHTGLKGRQPSTEGVSMERPKPTKVTKVQAAPAPAPKTKEVELPSGDIVIEEDKE
jgi:hypothetical protein